MGDYKDKLKSFREMADKLAVCGHTMMAADYRWAADTIEALESRLHESESELQGVIKRLHEVESERDAAIAGQETLQKELARVKEGK